VKQLIFYSDTGFPFSILAAAIRTGRLPADRRPQIEELASVLHHGMGKGDASIYSFEKEADGEKCLALWTHGQGDMVQRAITSFLGLYQIENYTLVKLDYEKTPVMTVGTWLTKLPLLRDTGLGLIHRSIEDIYDGLIKDARLIKQACLD